MILVIEGDAPQALRERRLTLFGPIEDVDHAVVVYDEIFRRCLAKLAACSGSGKWARFEQFGPSSRLQEGQARWVVECLVAYGYIERRRSLKRDAYCITHKGMGKAG